MTFISGGEGDDGGVTGKETRKPVTKVRDFVLAYVSMKQLDIFGKGTWFFNTGRC